MSAISESGARFENFMRGFAAAAQLRSRAGENGCFIEYVCLSTSMVDGLLRIGVILKHQLNNNTSDLLDEMLYQHDPKKIVRERDVFDKAFRMGVIDQRICDKLHELFDSRNQVVHRFIISEITTDQVLTIAQEFDEVIAEVNQCVRVLEDQQIERRIGMTHGPNSIPSDIRGSPSEQIASLADQKHGNLNLAAKLRRSLP